MSSNNLNPDKVLIFDLKGPLAHFRKYYTNSSSLSYLFPPRTVIAGLIAGIVGLPSERHTNKNEEVYYEKFSDDRCGIAVSIRTRIRRMMQTVNYIKTKTDKQSKYSFEALITGTRGAPTQIPLEILLPENGNDITYRVYFYHANGEVYNKLKQRLEEQRFVYPPYMGLSEFLASIDNVGEGNVSRNPKQDIELNSVCKLKDVEPDFSGNDLQYLIEKMPTGFSNDRTPNQPDDYILEIKSRIMKVKVKNNAICCSVGYSEGGCALIENIMFM